MYKTLEGIYENGKITLNEKPEIDIKKSKVIVTFLNKTDELKKFTIPHICKEPLEIKKVKTFSREELHNR